MSTATQQVTVSIQLVPGKNALAQITEDISLTSLDDSEGKGEFEVSDAKVAQAIMNAVHAGTITIDAKGQKGLEKMLTPSGSKAKEDKKPEAKKPRKAVFCLADNRTLWGTTDQVYILNRLNGQTTIEINSDECNQTQLQEINRALAAGTIFELGNASEIKDKIKEGKASILDIDELFENESRRENFALFMLDGSLNEIKELFSRPGYKRSDVGMFIKQEKKTRNRKEYLKLLEEYMQTAE